MTKDAHYDLWIKVLSRLPPAQSNQYGLNSLSLRGSPLWNTLDNELERAVTSTNFKKEIAK